MRLRQAEGEGPPSPRTFWAGSLLRAVPGEQSNVFFLRDLPVECMLFLWYLSTSICLSEAKLVLLLILSGSPCKRPLRIFYTISLMSSFIIPYKLLGRYSKFGAPMGLDAFKCKSTSATAGGLQGHPSCWLSRLTEQPWSSYTRGHTQIRKRSVGLCVETTWSDFWNLFFIKKSMKKLFSKK